MSITADIAADRLRLGFVTRAAGRTIDKVSISSRGFRLKPAFAAAFSEIRRTLGAARGRPCQGHEPIERDHFWQRQLVIRAVSEHHFFIQNVPGGSVATAAGEY